MRKSRTLGLLLISLSLFVCALHLQAVAQPSSRLYKVYNKERRVGFIDKMGKLVIDFKRLPAGVRVGDFSEGLASICYANADGSCRGVGFIDERGKVVIAPRFKMVREFSEGLAFVQTDEGAGFIDHRGEIVIRLKEVEAYEFHEGLAAANTGRLWGFIDRAGKPVIKEDYSRAESFSEGLAAVSVGIARNAKYGFINKQGAMVIPPQFQPELGHHNEIRFLSRFMEGLAKVKVGGLYGYIDKRGELIIKPGFLSAREFSEGLARVQTADGNMGYVDKSGHLVISLKATGGDDFQEGLAPVAVETERGRKWGFIDRTGKFVIEARFDNVSEFVGGVAAVYLEEIVVSQSGRSLMTRMGYIDKTGSYIWQPQ